MDERRAVIEHLMDVDQIDSVQFLLRKNYICEFPAIVECAVHTCKRKRIQMRKVYSYKVFVGFHIPVVLHQTVQCLGIMVQP